MNTQEYLQMLQMQSQNPQMFQSSGMQTQDVPRRTYSHHSPIHAGSREAIESVRESLGHRTSDFEKSMGRLSANIGRALFAKSGTQFGNAMAQIPYDPYAAEEQKLAENIKILQYLQAAEEAERIQTYKERALEQDILNKQIHSELQNRQLSEQIRHHRAVEGQQNALHQYEIDNQKEARELANNIKEESGDYVQPISAMKPAMQQYANKAIDSYIEKTNNAVEGLNVVSRMRQIASDNPDILNSWQFIVANRYNQHPDFWRQAALNLGLSENEKDALFEMASLAKEFNIKTLGAIPAKGLNQMIERELFSANPNARMSKGALFKVLDKAQLGLEHGYQEYSKAARYGREGFLYKINPREFTKHPATAQQHSVMSEAENPMTAHEENSLQSLSDEELRNYKERILRKYSGQ